MSQKNELTIDLVAERMGHARRVLCAGRPEREVLFAKRRTLMLTYVALKRVAKLANTTVGEVAEMIGLPADKFDEIRASLKDPTFLSPEELEWYNNLLMTGVTIAPIRDTPNRK